MKYNTIIFDVDGTLINTRKGIMLSVKYVTEKYNLTNLSDEELYKFTGTSPLQTAFCQFCNIDEALAQKCAEEFRTYYNNHELFNAKVYNGIIRLLNYIKNEGYKLAVATYKREDLVIKILNHFGLDKYFDIICGADNKNKLTKSDMINKCIINVGANKGNSLMIGDSCHDAKAAQQLGIKFIGVTYGFGFESQQDINEYPNILSAETPQDILNYLMTNKAYEEQTK